MARLKISIHFSFIIFACLLVFFRQGFLLLNYLVTIILHELSHAYIARRLGYNIQNIKLTPFGVCLNLKSSTLAPDDEIKIAIAGPLCNLAISLLLFALWWILPATYNHTYLFCFANLITCLFNLLPAFPLDGGRVFRALLRQKYDDQTAYKACNITNIILCILLLLMFVFSLFIQVNLTYLFVVFCILPSKDTAQNYTFIDYSMLKKKRKVVRIKNMYFCDTEPLYKVLKHIDNFSYLNAYIYDSEGCFKGIIGEKELLSRIEKYPATCPLKNTSKEHNSTF